MAREQEKLSKDVLAVLDKKTNDLRLVSEMNEQTGEFNTVSTAPVTGVEPFHSTAERF